MPVITASNITRDGALRLSGLAATSAVSEEQRLQVGDLCIRRALGTRERSLAIYEVEAVAASAAIDDSIIAVRLLSEVKEPLRVFVRDYLRAEQTLTALRAQGVTDAIGETHIELLPVVIPSADTSALLEDLWRAESLCGTWVRWCSRGSGGVSRGG